MKHPATTILSALVALLATLCAWEYSVIQSQRQELKARQAQLDGQAVRLRNLQQQIADKDRQMRLLTAPTATLPDDAATEAARRQVEADHQSYMDGKKQRQWARR